MNKILEQIENQLVNTSVELAQFEEGDYNIDWPDDPAEEMMGLNQEINYRLKRFHGGRNEDPKKLKKDIQIRYPYSYMFEGYGSCMVEVKPDGNICYDFVGMISSSTINLERWYGFRSDFRCFSELEGLKELCAYLSKVEVTNDKIEPILLMDGCEIYWTDFIYTDYLNPYFEDEEYCLHLEFEELGTWEADWELDYFPAEDNVELLRSEWLD